MPTDVQRFDTAVASALGAGCSFSTAQQVQAADNLGAVSLNTSPLTVTQAVCVLLHGGFDPGGLSCANNIYGGRDLLTLFTEAEINAKVAAGDFSGMFAGDYITKTITVDGTSYTRKWLCAGFDHYFYTGDTPCTTHHIVMIPDDALGMATMNSTNTTSGGFLGSAMWKTTLPKYTKAIQDAFGASHVMKRRAKLCATVNTSIPSKAGSGWYGGAALFSGQWTDVYAYLPTEAEIVGTSVLSASVADHYLGSRQLPLFRFYSPLSPSRAGWWLAGVVAVDMFACFSGWGDLAPFWSSDTTLCVRPLFCWC